MRVKVGGKEFDNREEMAMDFWKIYYFTNFQKIDY